MSTPKKGKRFVYSLETLLNVRGIRKKQQEDKYSESQQQLKLAKKREKEAKQKEDQKYQEFHDMLDSDELPDVQMIQIQQQYLEVVKEETIKQQEAAKEAEKVKEEERVKLADAAKAEKIIEKDKEKTRWAWKKLMDKEEGKFLDDVAGVGFDKKRRKKMEEEGES